MNSTWKSSIAGVALFVPSLLLSVLLAGGSFAEEVTAGDTAAGSGVWKTAYYKRGFVGAYDANWAGGTNATLRFQVPLRFGGSQVRVYVQGMYKETTELSGMNIVRGATAPGQVEGPRYPLTFHGEAGLTLDGEGGAPKGGASDAIAVPIVPGIWYVQESYASGRYPYAYSVDEHFAGPPDAFEQPTLPRRIGGCHLGGVNRIDIFTTDTRPTVACWGDSITHGTGSSPNQMQTYPDLLAKLIDRPTLNFGVNGDVATYAGGAPYLLREMKGVDTVIFLMGINDILGNSDFKLASFVNYAGFFIRGCKQQGLRVLIGTILPAGGANGYHDLAKEELRGAINAWIRTQKETDGVIDFDASVADPADPLRMRADCHSGDWLHPNDAGYACMAAAAAEAIARLP